MVESTGLENRHTGNRIVGSNPTLSATLPGAFSRMLRQPPRASRSVAFLRFGRALVGFLAFGKNPRGKACGSAVA